jgi:hypothetical protein
MTIQQNFELRPKTLKQFTATGVLVSGVHTTMCNNLRVVVENVGGGNTVVVRGKLFPQTAWQTLATINGSSAGTTVDISLVDEYQIECTAYAASGGTPKVIASAFFKQATGGGGGGGTVTGASNVGAGGIGLFSSDVANVLQFKNINAGSNKVTVADDLVNLEVDIDVDETKVDVRNLKNVSPGVNGSFAGWTDAGLLGQVPGWTFDDIGALQVGAQNSITIPVGTTSYYSVGISPTISNAVGLVSGVQLNSPMNAVVTNYNGFTVNGYGTSAPTNYIAFSSNTNYSGSGTNATHFDASMAWDVSGTVKGLTVTSAGDAATLQGVELVATGSYTDVTGISVNLTGATTTNRPVVAALEGGIFSTTCTFSANTAVAVDSGNLIRPVFEVQAGSPVTGTTDILLSNLAGFMDFKDDYSSGPLGLGVASVAFVSQVAVAAGKTASNVSMLTAGLAVDATSAGGTVTNLHLIRGFAANFGGSLTIGTLYGLQIESGISALATTAFGISVEDTGAENYLAKSLKIDGGTKVVSDSTIGLEIGGTKSFRLAQLTTAQRNALPNIAGTMVYDTNTGKAYLNDGVGWHQFG